MASGLDVVVRFIGDASSIEASAAKVEGTGAKLKTWAKGVGAAIGIAFAAKQVKDWVSAAEEAEAATHRLEQTMKNAGDTTGKWAKHAEDLATALMKKTGIDDEVIKGSQAILATFHEVSDATGQQSGIFDRATKAAVDLSKTGFGDVDSAAKQLGKALQDPEKGLSALKRAGVNFTEAQKEQIKALVDSGDQLGAMKIILGEVENQVGGVAEKTATSGAKMSAAWHETQESLGKALLPVLEQLAPILERVAGAVQNNASWLVPLAAAILGVVLAVKAWTVVQTTLDALLAANPIGAVILAVVAIGAAIAIVWTQWDTIWNWIANHPAYAILIAVLAAPIAWFVLIVGGLKMLFTNWSAIWQAIVDATDTAANWIVGAFNDVVAFFGRVPGMIGSALSSLVAIIIAPFQAAWNFVVGLWNGIYGFFAGIVGQIASALSGVVDAITSPFREAWGIVQGIASTIGDAIHIAKGAYNSFAHAFNAIQVKIPSIDIGPVHIGGETIGLPDLPILDTGGIISRPTLALLAANSRPEAVVPLNAGTFGNTYNINVEVAAGVNPAAVGAATVDAIRAYERVAGQSWRT